MLWTPLQLAFESTAPWRCALQMRAQRAASTAETEHALLRTVFCRSVVLKPPPAATTTMANDAGFIGDAAMVPPPGLGSWRSLSPSDGMEAAPPIPTAWLRRLAPSGLIPTDEDGNEDYDWDDDADGPEVALPARLLPPGVLKLETFLRHVESLSSAVGVPKSTIACDDGSNVPTAGAAGAAAASWSSVLNGGGSAEADLEEASEEGRGMLTNALIALQERLRRVLQACPGESAGVGDHETLKAIANTLRVAEWTAEMMLVAGPANAPDGSVKLIQKALRKVASMMRRALPATPPAGAGVSAELSAAKVWARAHRVLLALRSCLLTFARLAADQRGGASNGWLQRETTWPEPLYIGMVSEPQTLVQGVKMLCALINNRKQGNPASSSTQADGATQGGGGDGGGGTSTDQWRGRPGDEMDVMDLDFDSEPQAMDAQGATAGSPRGGGAAGDPNGDAGFDEPATEADGSGALHAALECIDLWARTDPQVGERLLIGLPSALESVHVARLRTRILALRTLSTCIRASPPILNANRAPRMPVSAAAEGEAVVAVGANQSTLIEAIEKWEAPAKALLADVKSKLQKAASRVRKLKIDEMSNRDIAAEVESKIAAAAASCDCALRPCPRDRGGFRACCPGSAASRRLCARAESLQGAVAGDRRQRGQQRALCRRRARLPHA